MASTTKTSNTKTTKTAKSNKYNTTKSTKSNKSNITKSTMDANIPTSEFSIFIPSVFNNLDEQVVIDTFNTLFGADCVERVDFWVPQTYKGRVKFKMAFVHFKKMPNTDQANKFKQSIEEGKEIRIHYTDRYFWKCLMNKKANKTTSSAEEKPKFEPKMTIGELPNDKNKSWGDIAEEEDEEENDEDEEDEEDEESGDEEE